MSNETGIVFQVETDKILNILTSEIYDSPLALLRENLRNAYDAVRMRLVPLGRPLSDGRIDLTISGNTISIARQRNRHDRICTHGELLEGRIIRKTVGGGQARWRSRHVRYRRDGKFRRQH